MGTALNINTILQILATIFIAWVAYNNKVTRDQIKAEVSAVKDKFGVLFTELEKKQTIEKCDIFHHAHDDIHRLEKESNKNNMDKMEDDINKIGKIARGES
ncbi:MAG: hypothetical protein U9Q21_02625 [Candidatus Auribacterota bacterium]|nr:hypothetical protein [Candidatus Auribacterota bacterium]